MDCVWIELPHASAEDPLFTHKRDILEQKELSSKFSIGVIETREKCEVVFDAMLKVARVLKLNEVEIYFLEEDDFGPFNGRNEVEALHLVLSTLKGLEDENKYISSIDSLVSITLAQIGQLEEVVEVSRPGVVCEGEKETRLLAWAQSEGIESSLNVAVFEGFGRGARAAVDIAVGDVILKIPEHMLICDEAVLGTEMQHLAFKGRELSGETRALLWSMRERHDPASKFAPYFASLPDSFKTGLSFGPSALKALDGTMVLEEILQAKEHLRSQYNMIFPALSDLYPAVFPKEYYTWELFLWACELWYSNGLKISFQDGSIKTCLVPLAGLMNHEIYPHVTHYSKIDSASGALILRSVRPCRAGQQCFLSYGAFSNSHLLTFYGFALGSRNPFDVIPIDLDLSDAPDRLALIEKWNLGLSHMIRGSWFSRSKQSPFGLPTRLLATLRIALMDDSEARMLCAIPRHDKISLENEVKTYETLISILNPVRDSLGDIVSWDESNGGVGVAIAFKNSQILVLQSASHSCSLALEALTS